MKTINFELSKRLNDLGLLDNIETEYVNITDWGIFERDGEPNPSTYTVLSEELLFNENIINTKYKTINDIINDENSLIEINYKTLTLEELIKFISDNVNNEGRIYCNLELQKEVWDTFSVLEIFDIKKAEVMLEYLLDNNLLPNK